MESAYKVGDYVIVNRRYAQDHMDGKKFRGRIGVVNIPKPWVPDKRTWYEVQLIDIGMEAICYDDELERDLLQELAGA
jgi:hypothetical protein